MIFEYKGKLQFLSGIRDCKRSRSDHVFS